MYHPIKGEKSNDIKQLYVVIVVSLILAYHMHTSHVSHDDVLHNKSHTLKAIDMSCEGGACDEKNDHKHDHKKKRKAKLIHRY